MPFVLRASVNEALLDIRQITQISRVGYGNALENPFVSVLRGREMVAYGLI